MNAAVLGKKCRLKVTKQVDFGFFLDGGDIFGELLMPKRYAPKGCEVDKMLDVFIYLDSEDRPIATTEKPYVKVGQSAYLRVVASNHAGAFMDWGVSKDLFVPKAEQRKPMQKGSYHVVHVYVDATGRIAGSSKLDYFLAEEDHEHQFKANQTVPLLISRRTDMGMIAVIHHTHLGLIHHNDALDTIKIGDKVDGMIKNIRKDGKINLKLARSDSHLSHEIEYLVLAHLQHHGGSSHLSDKASAEDIWKIFKISKSSYKKILGRLYKAQKIRIEKDKIWLI